MEITIKSTALMTMDEFLEYLEMRGSRNTTAATPTVPEDADELLNS